MSELSKLFVKQGYRIDREMSVGPISTRTWICKDDITIMVDFTTGQSLLLSVGDYRGWKKNLAAARKICTQFMGAEPICSYDAKPAFCWTHYMEWDLMYPEERLRIIVNQGEDLAQVQFRNLRLFGSYCISDFEDAVLKQAYIDVATSRQKYPGVYGKDPGECDAVRVSKASEFELFLEYTRLENIRMRQQQYQGTARTYEDIYSILARNLTIDGFQKQQIELALDYVSAKICQKVGIKILKQPSDKHRLRLDEAEFIKWYNYHSRSLTTICFNDSLLNEVFDKYNRGQSVSSYAPTGNWREA